MEVMAVLENALCEITGMDAVTLQPAAGAHGEMTGIMLIRALLESRGNPRKKIADSRFGARHESGDGRDGGLRGQNIHSNDRGMVDLAELERAVDEDVAGADDDESEHARRVRGEHHRRSRTSCTPRAGWFTWTAPT